MWPERAFSAGRRRCGRLLSASLLAALAPAAEAASAMRIAAVDWAAAETLAMLGVMPVAVPEFDVYRQWLPQSALPEDTVDLGSRTEPNFEVLAILAPERIFVSGWQKALLPRFEKIAPTELATIFDARKMPFQRIRDLAEQVGRVTQKEQQAARALQDFDADMARLASRLQPLRGRRVYVAVLHENGSQAFIYGPGSWVHSMIELLGMKNALREKTSVYGNALVNISAFAADPDAHLIYLDQGDRTRRAERILKDSSLWRSLPAVRAGRVTSIASFYALGGLPSARRCGNLLGAAMMSQLEGAR